MLIEKFWVALGEMPSAAVTVPVKIPPVVGMPEITPAEESERPLGSAPVVTENAVASNC